MPRERRGSNLQRALFGDRASPRFALISTGIAACIDYSARLLAAVETLASVGKYAAARFLLATTMEEIGKVHVMLEMLKLRPGAGQLASLCGAFYNHDAKSAFARIAIRASEANWVIRTRNVTSVDALPKWQQKLWARQDARVGTNELAIPQAVLLYFLWAYPYEPESPDDVGFPSDHAMKREWSLYVDIDDYRPDAWYVPVDDGELLGIGKDVSDFEKTRASLAQLQQLVSDGAFSEEKLQAWHRICSGNAFDLRSEEDRVLAVAKEVQHEVGQTIFPPLIQWPMYVVFG
jgi:AbiV family abortive infection protein